MSQITTIKADAASPAAISSLVDSAMNEEGHLDFFFANAGIAQIQVPILKPDASEEEKTAYVMKGVYRPSAEIEAEEFVEVMRINVLK